MYSTVLSAFTMLLVGSQIATCVPMAEPEANNKHVVVVTKTVWAHPEPHPTHHHHHAHHAHHEHHEPAPPPEKSHKMKKTKKTHKKKKTPSSPSTPYHKRVIHAHNVHRSNHSAKALEWSSHMESTAATVARSCNFAHNMGVDGGGYGQNIAAGTSPEKVGDMITNEFYNAEEPYYSNLYGKAHPSMTNFEHWGHFSQMVWKGTTHVGCHTQHCPNGVGGVGDNVNDYFTVCNYSPRGNIAGRYGNEVGRPLGHKTVCGMDGC